MREIPSQAQRKQVPICGIRILWQKDFLVDRKNILCYFYLVNICPFPKHNAGEGANLFHYSTNLCDFSTVLFPFPTEKAVFP